VLHVILDVVRPMTHVNFFIIQGGPKNDFQSLLIAPVSGTFRLRFGGFPQTLHAIQGGIYTR